MKVLIRNKTLYEEPKSDAPPPWWIRGLLILTCTGVSFAHGGNDGQKGMGLIMLILIGAAPTAYALNRTMPDAGDAGLHRRRQQGAGGVRRPRRRRAHVRRSTGARKAVGDGAARPRRSTRPEVFARLAVAAGDIASAA